MSESGIHVLPTEYIHRYDIIHISLAYLCRMYHIISYHIIVEYVQYVHICIHTTIEYLLLFEI